MPAEKSTSAGYERESQVRTRGLRHRLFPHRCGFPVGRESKQRKSIPVIGICQIKYAREAGSGRVVFLPGSIGPLRAHQIIDSVKETFAAQVASREQRQKRPRGLRWRAGIRDEAALVITGAALAPASVAILIGANEFERPLDGGFVLAHVCRTQTT